jgi:hypothetical protein
MRKIIYVILTILLLLIMGWWGINLLLIPRFILPWARSAIIEMEKGQPYRFAIGNIEYQPHKGFLIKDFTLFLPRDKKIFSVREVDLDINYLHLLWKRIEITNFKVFGADLAVERSRKGRWNFEDLLESKLFDFPDTGFTPVIREINFYNSEIDYADAFLKPKIFKRSFRNVNLSIRNPEGNKYLIWLSGGDNRENLSLNIDYEFGRGKFSGNARIKTMDFDQYRDYYLKSYFSPWELGIKNAAADFSFAYNRGDLRIQGKVKGQKVQVSRDNFLAAGEAAVDFKLEMVKGKLKPGALFIDLEANDLSLRSDKNQIFDRSAAVVFIDSRKMVVKKFTGRQIRNDFDLVGEFAFSPLRDLSLSGEAFGANHLLRIKEFPGERAELNWKMKTELSSLEIFGRLVDFKKLNFSANLDGNLDLGEWPEGFGLHLGKPALVSVEVSAKKLQGKVELDGKLEGMAGYPESWAGGVKIKLQDFSAFGIEPQNFLLNLSSQKGVFQTEIPTTSLFNGGTGTISGVLRLSVKKWGAELDAKEIDLASLEKANPKLKGLKGKFSGKAVLAGEWGNKDAIIGGGYIDLKNSDLKNAPIVKDLEAEIGELQKGFTMPNFTKIEGNFDVKKSQVLFENVYCKAADLDIRVSGRCGFDGAVEATAGVRMFGGNKVKTLRQIVLPVTIGIDWMANSIQIKISGVLPNLSQSTSVMPMNWLKEFFKINYRADPDRYSLDALWQ